MNQARVKEAQAFENAQKQNIQLTNRFANEKVEHVVRMWGRATSNPLFIGKYGKPNEMDYDDGHGVYARWFDTEEEVQAFRAEVKKYLTLLTDNTLVFSTDSGTMTRKRVRAVATVTFRGKEYVLKKNYGYGYPLGTVIFDWEENNTSCDCNRLPMLLRQHPDVLPTEEEQKLIDGNTCYEGRVMVTDFRIELLD
jgi:hypothetical protein